MKVGLESMKVDLGPLKAKSVAVGCWGRSSTVPAEKRHIDAHHAHLQTSARRTEEEAHGSTVSA